MLGNDWLESMKSLGVAYTSIYEKDNRTPAQKQAAENEFDQFEAETGGDGDMDEWRKNKATKAAKSKTTAQRMAAAHDKKVVDKLNSYSKNEGVEVYQSLSDAYASIYEKKKECKDGYYYCNDEKKCKKKKTKKPGMMHGYGGYHDHDDDNDGGTDGGTGGGDGGGGGGGGGGE